MAIEQVAVIGAGEWGTALAQAAAMAGRRVTLIGRDPDVLAEINRSHTNSSISGRSACRRWSAPPTAFRVRTS